MRCSNCGAWMNKIDSCEYCGSIYYTKNYEDELSEFKEEYEQFKVDRVSKNEFVESYTLNKCQRIIDKIKFYTMAENQTKERNKYKIKYCATRL